MKFLPLLFLMSIASAAYSQSAEPAVDPKSALEEERRQLTQRLGEIDLELAELAKLAPRSAQSPRFELESSTIATFVLQAPHGFALPVRIAGRWWEIGAGNRLEILSSVKTGRDEYWRITDGTRVGYVRNLTADVFRNGVKLSKYKEQDLAFEELQHLWKAQLAELVGDRKLVVLGAYPEGPNSAGGAQVNIVWRHLDPSKVVKYITFTVVPYNGVGDRVACTITGAGPRKLQATGPFDAIPLASATYGHQAVFDVQWYNPSITCITVTQVDVQYMDGSSKTYIKDLDSILSPEFQNNCTLR